MCGKNPCGCEDPCKKKCNPIDFQCVEYNGANLDCIGVATGDNGEEILGKLNDACIKVQAFGAGPAGDSAYDVAVNNGFVGTEVEWLASLEGSNGTSAYQIAVNNGFVGTETEWLASLQGEDGECNCEGITQTYYAEEKTVVPSGSQTPGTLTPLAAPFQYTIPTGAAGTYRIMFQADVTLTSSLSGVEVSTFLNGTELSFNMRRYVKNNFLLTSPQSSIHNINLIHSNIVAAVGDVIEIRADGALLNNGVFIVDKIS